MKKIKLTKGKYAIVDDEDYHYLSRFKWSFFIDDKYPMPCREFLINKSLVVLPMWKFIIPQENNKKVLFLNKNSLDNRKVNIMLVPIYIANHFSNKKKIGVSGSPTSIYKGVSYSKTYKGHKKWMSDIVCNGKRFSKHCSTEKDAAISYNEKAKEFYGEFAYQNKIV